MSRPGALAPRHLALAALVLALAACRSPEAERVRGAGAGTGADIRNRDRVIQMHAGSRMYYETPCALPEEQCTGPLPASGFPAPEREPR